MALELRSDQSTGIDNVARKISGGVRRIIFQLATGGGKTVLFAGLINRFLLKQKKRVVVLVHREELLKQSRRTLFSWYDIVSIPVMAGQDYLANGEVYVGMVETANNRMKKRETYFGDVGLLIIDEAHRNDFRKMYKYFPNAIIIGFTATPISSDKNDPLKNHFDDIVCGIDIPELIKINQVDEASGLVQNITHDFHSVSRTDLKGIKLTQGDYNKKELSRVYSEGRHVLNTVLGYKTFCDGKKAIVFNCDIDHSEKVAEAFRMSGYDARHLDGETADGVRKATLQWFKDTPGAILCNVDLLTAGYDEPSIEAVVVNLSTKSIVKWLQMAGRGGRPYPGKRLFHIVDMGDNATLHGDWNVSIDWVDKFRNPEKIGKEGGEAPSKACKGCRVIIHAATKTCPHCGADNVKEQVYDRVGDSMDLIRTRPLNINVPEMILVHSTKAKQDGQPYKPISLLHTIKYNIVLHTQRAWRLRRMDDHLAARLLSYYQMKVDEWCKEMKVPFDHSLQVRSKEWFYQELQRVYKWVPIGGAINQNA